MAMQWCRLRLVAVLAAGMVLGAVAWSGPAQAQSMLSGDYVATNAPYKDSERAGREIWFFATAFNDRFFTYSYPQRLGAAIDWYRVLAAEHRDQLFQGWGAIPDPDCCIPGQPNCPAKSLCFRVWLLSNPSADYSHDLVVAPATESDEAAAGCPGS